MEARAGADPHRRGGRSCRGLGLAGAPEGEGRDTPGLGNGTARHSFIRFRSSAEHPTSGIKQTQTNSVFYPFRGEMTHVVHPRGSLMSGRFVDYRVSRISGRVQPVMRSARATAS